MQVALDINHALAKGTRLLQACARQLQALMHCLIGTPFPGMYHRALGWKERLPHIQWSLSPVLILLVCNDSRTGAEAA